MFLRGSLKILRAPWGSLRITKIFGGFPKGLFIRSPQDIRVLRAARFLKGFLRLSWCIGFLRGFPHLSDFDYIALPGIWD